MLLTLLSGAFRLLGFITWAEAIEARQVAIQEGRKDQQQADLKASNQEAQNAQALADNVGKLSDADLDAQLERMRGPDPRGKCL